jgi:hypothetical protein
MVAVNGKNLIKIAITLGIVIILVHFVTYENISSNKLTSVLDYTNDIEIEKNTIQEYFFNIIFVETNEKKSNLSLKLLCAIESAALNNPDALINFFSVNAVVNDYLTDRYKNIQSKKFLIEDVFKDTPMYNWWIKNKNIIKKGEFNFVHTSDALRVALIWKYGGIYLDTDTITVRNLNYLINFPGVGANDESSANNAVINFPKHHNFIAQLIKEFVKNYDPGCWACKGPLLVSRVFRDYCKTQNFYKTHLLTKEKIYETIMNSDSNYNKSQCDIHIYPINYFYPISWFNSEKLFNNFKIDKEKFLDTYIVHFWNKVSKNYHAKPGDGSVYEYFSKLNCPVIYKMNSNLVF